MGHGDQSAGSGQMWRDDDTIAEQGNTICGCTDAMRIIPAEDSELIENGIVFQAVIRFTLANTLTRWLVFLTPTATEEDPVYVAWAPDKVKADVNNFQYDLFRDVVVTTPGAAQPVINQNEVLRTIVTALSQLYPSPASVTVADEDAQRVDLDDVLGAKIGLPASATGVGGAVPGGRFKVLDSNTWYGIRIKNLSGEPVAANANVKSTFAETRFPKLYATANP